MSLLERFRTDEGMEVPDLAAYENPAPRPVEPTRLGCTAGASADVLRDLRAAADRADARRNATAMHRAFDPNGVPFGFAPRAIDIYLIRTGEELAAIETDAAAEFDENLATAAALLKRHPCPHLDSAVQMLLAPIVAQLAEETGAEAAAR